MSKILRRPMFRGGRVDSRGTGITTGLDRPGMQGGGMPPATGGSLLQRATDFFTKPALGPDGKPIPFQTRNFADDAMFVLGPGKFLKAGGGGLNLLRQMGKFPLSGSGKELVEKVPFLSNQYLKQVARPYLSGMKETAKEMVKPIKEYSLPFGLGTLGTGYGLSKMYEGFKERQEGEPPPPEEDTGLTPDQQRIADLEKQLNDLLNKPAPEPKDMEESVEIDKEKFAKILGRDKARGEDISDMLLSFSSKALAPEADVKSAFAEFAADEVKRPSRTRAIEDNAAALAINKYIKGEISKGELDKLMALDKAKLKNKVNIARASLTFEGVLSDTAQKAGKSEKNLGVIQRALKLTPDTENLAFGGDLPKGEDAAGKITPDTIYVRDSVTADGAKELIYIDSATGELVVFKTIY